MCCPQWPQIPFAQTERTFQACPVLILQCSMCWLHWIESCTIFCCIRQHALTPKDCVLRWHKPLLTHLPSSSTTLLDRNTALMIAKVRKSNDLTCRIQAVLLSQMRQVWFSLEPKLLRLTKQHGSDSTTGVFSNKSPHVFFIKLIEWVLILHLFISMTFLVM